MQQLSSSSPLRLTPRCRDLFHRLYLTRCADRDDPCLTRNKRRLRPQLDKSPFGSLKTDAQFSDFTLLSEMKGTRHATLSPPSRLAPLPHTPRAAAPPLRAPNRRTSLAHPSPSATDDQSRRALPWIHWSVVRPGDDEAVHVSDDQMTAAELAAATEYLNSGAFCAKVFPLPGDIHVVTGGPPCQARRATHALLRALICVRSCALLPPRRRARGCFCRRLLLRPWPRRRTGRCADRGAGFSAVPARRGGAGTTPSGPTPSKSRRASATRRTSSSSASLRLSSSTSRSWW